MQPKNNAVSHSVKLSESQKEEQLESIQQKRKGSLQTDLLMNQSKKTHEIPSKFKSPFNPMDEEESKESTYRWLKEENFETYLDDSISRRRYTLLPKDGVSAGNKPSQKIDFLNFPNWRQDWLKIHNKLETNAGIELSEKTLKNYEKTHFSPEFPDFMEKLVDLVKILKASRLKSNYSLNLIFLKSYEYAWIIYYTEIKNAFLTSPHFKESEQIERQSYPPKQKEIIFGKVVKFKDPKTQEEKNDHATFSKYSSYLEYCNEFLAFLISYSNLDKRVSTKNSQILLLNMHPI